MKKTLLKITSGFLFGIGLGGALFSGGYLYSEYMSSKYEREYISFDENAGLSIVSHSERKTDNGIIVVGTIENNGGNTWGHIDVEVEVFDKEGTFIDECHGNVGSNIKAGEKENFKIICGRSCGNTKFPDYESISIRINRAGYVSEDDGNLTFH